MEPENTSGVRRYYVPVAFEKEEKPMDCEKVFSCIIGEEEQLELASALEGFGCEVFYSTDGKRVPDYVPDNCRMVFVCSDFEGGVFDYLHSRKYRILGPPSVMFCASRNKSLPTSVRPVFSCTMEGTVICFTGFKEREKLHQLCSLVHYMGGIIRKEITSTVTHVVAHSVFGLKYKDAVGMGTPIMDEAWIHECWKVRHNIDKQATDDDMMCNKQLSFRGCRIAFMGFSEEETSHMSDIAITNGAATALLEDSGLTHVVIADAVDPSSTPCVSSRINLVKPNWFWESVQIEACADEALYQVKSQPLQQRRPRKRSSSIRSIEFSLLEASLISLSSPSSKSAAKPETSAKDKSSARYHIASELLQTEKNFVSILSIIVKVFKDPLEMESKRGGPILSHEDIKSIFDNIPDILSAHEKLVSELKDQTSQWSEQTCIGSVFVKQAEEMLRVYSHYVNFFELSKEALSRCDKQYPRFHAFLKANESRPECGRQTLAELMITPIQRIPRIILLLQDLVKHTDVSHPDYKPLEKAVENLKEVMSHINEDKRKTEGQMQMFEVLRDIDGCPATVLSSQRAFLRRIDAVDLGNPNKKGDPITLFLFSDSVEIAKRKLGTGFGLKATGLRYKHLEFIPYVHIQLVLSFADSGELSNSFGLLVRWPDDPQERVLAFQLASDEDAKEDVISCVSKRIASANFSTDPDDFVRIVTGEVFTVLSKSGSMSLRRALHGAKKKVKRAFSGHYSRQPLSSLSVNFHGGSDASPLNVSTRAHTLTPVKSSHAHHTQLQASARMSRTPSITSKQSLDDRQSATAATTSLLLASKSSFQPATSRRIETNFGTEV